MQFGEETVRFLEFGTLCAVIFAPSVITLYCVAKVLLIAFLEHKKIQ